MARAATITQQAVSRLVAQPLCATCGNTVTDVSWDDLQAEAQYAKKMREKLRPWFCSTKCFRAKRDAMFQKKERTSDAES